MNSVPWAEDKKQVPPPPRKKRRVDYASKLASNEAATLRWLTKLKLVSNKLAKFTAQRKRIMAAMAEQKKQAKPSGTFARKFI